MQTIEIHLSDPTYYDLVARAAEDHQDVDQFAKAHLMRAVSNADPVAVGRSFEERIVQAFRLKPGTESAANVIGVATRMADGLPWADAYHARAKAFATDNPDVKDWELYAGTVHDCCTRRLGLSAAEFEDRVHTLTEVYHQRTNTTPDGMTTDPPTPGVSPDSYEVRLTDGSEVVTQFGTDPAADQSQMMQLVVEVLTVEHDLMDRIPIPYIVDQQTLINKTPTAHDSDEEMHASKRLSTDYYLNTSAGKAGKEAQLTALANECGLGLTFGEAWERR